MSAYDSGWRDITSLLATPAAGGRIHLRRVGIIVYVQVDGLYFDTTKSFVDLGIVLPPGFRPARDSYIGSAIRTEVESGAAVRLRYNGQGYVYLVKSGLQIYSLGSFITNDSPPMLLPGNAS